MKNKKSLIGVTFLLSLIFSLTLIITIWMGASKLFVAVTSEADESYEKFLAAIDDVKEGERKSIKIEMDKDSAIVFFDKDEDWAGLEWSYMTTSAPAASVPTAEYIESEVDKFIIFDKPDTQECKDSSCICHFKDCRYSEQESRYGGEYSCQKTGHGRYFGRCETTGTPRYDSCTGMVIERDIAKYERAVMGEKRRIIYVENYKGKLGFCFEPPCLEEEDKEEIDIIVEQENRDSAKELLTSFVENYDRCTSDKECEKEVILDLPSSGFRINHTGQGRLILQEKEEDSYEDIATSPGRINSCDAKDHIYTRNTMIEIVKDDQGNFCIQQA